MSQAQGKCCLCSSNGSVHPIPDVVFLEDLYGINLPVGSVLCCGCETLLVRFSNHFAFARRIRGHHAHLLTSGACGLCLYGGNTENFVDAYGSNVNLSTFVEMVYKIPSKSLVVANVCQPCSSSLGQFYNHWSLYSPRGNALVQQFAQVSITEKIL
ncbi:uncharacterized protein LOC129572930 isoform X2 [Sitodiplosis mosellana]|uniref:uncharacterized protein LOC129572930 isoform X2 n=1 Tax=Sitodiplosis mosellana TaxID=263140 RepID=UPI0024453622|nr:uncharacterized protein LOC129572930 isoform X2 [Sitodiplosis mosellana]